ncbi:VanW family protein [Aeromicrobium sp.]|uniref:VanW family protein n=1 Tax=Aeromicrobium sp. TaxID=1871063 RepID=UPI003D6BBF01
MVDDQQPRDPAGPSDPDPDDPTRPEAEAEAVEENDDLDHEPEPDPEPELESDQGPETEPIPAVPAWSVMGSLTSDETTSDQTTSDETTSDETTGDEPPRRRQVRRAIIGTVLVLGVLYVIGVVMTGLLMPANATIGGVDVGGMSPGSAREAVDRELSPRTDDEVVLKHDGKEFTIKPKAADLSFDLDRSIEQAGGQHSFNPATMAGLLFGEHEFDPVVDADDAKLKSAVASIASSVDREVVEAQITFPKSKPKARQPKEGLAVSKSDTADAVLGGYLVARDPIPVPTSVVDPAVDADGLDEAMKSIAEPAVSGPVALKVGTKKVQLPVSAYASALTVRVIDGKLTPEIDPETLAAPLTSSTTGIGKKAVDATVRIENGRPVIVPGKEGVGLQPKEMAEKLVPAITKTGEARSVEVEAKVVDPEFTTKDARKLRIKERVSSFSTYFPYAPYRNTNQGRAAALIDGTILEPGETFSMNDAVGERTAANGFTKGTIISGGVFREELGGGVSQVATTTYNAAFFAGLDDIEHHPHAFYLDRYPMGREATLYFGSLDLRFRNSTDYGVLIRANVTPSTPSSQGEMHVEMWSTKVWDIKAGRSDKRNFREPGKQYDDTKRCVPQEPIKGFDIDVFRTFMRGGEVVKRETDTASYQAADKVICGKKPKN